MPAALPAAVAFFGYLLNVATTVLAASGPNARRMEAVKEKLQASDAAPCRCDMGCTELCFFNSCNRNWLLTGCYWHAAWLPCGMRGTEAAMGVLQPLAAAVPATAYAHQRLPARS